MKQLHSLEIKNIVFELQSLLDSKVQNIFISEKGLGFELFKSSVATYLWFDLDPRNPFILSFEKLPQSIKLKKTAPMLLFLKAHLDGKRLSEIRHLEDLGRVVEFEFGYENPLKLEIRLFPHGTNAIAHFEKKKISFDKVKEIKAGGSDLSYESSNRSLLEVTQMWLDFKKSLGQTSKDPLLLKEKEIQKKEKAIEKTNEHLLELQNDKWEKLGEWLKANQTLKVPKAFAELIDHKKSFSQNLQNAFEKAKKNQEKISGTLERIEILKNEILRLQNANPSEFKNNTQESKKSNKADGWKGYRLALNPKVEVFVGKNAQENLNILRFAQSWDYWMHIKDYPGAHGIIRRPRNYEISEEELKTVARFIASKSRKSAHFLGPNDVFEVLIAECRYVRPIKGDKLGRVNYSSERVLACRMK